MNKAFSIVLEDDYLIVINKITKILVVPSPKKEKITLTTLLRKEKNHMVYPCHRLDRETTGLIVYAKTKQIEQAIAVQFKLHEIKKKYIAFIKGKMKKKKGVLSGLVIDKEGNMHFQHHGVFDVEPVEKLIDKLLNENVTNSKNSDDGKKKEGV